MGIEVSRFDFENDPSLSLSVFPGFVIIFDGEPVDMLICTFSGITNNFTAHAKVTIKIVRVLEGHRDLWADFHIAVFDATLIGIDKDIFAIRIEPHRGNLWGTIRHHSSEKKPGRGRLVEKIEKLFGEIHLDAKGLGT